jgi:Tfp pilus assembly protein PilP
VKIGNIAVSLAVLAAVGCKQPSTGPTTQEFAQGRDALKSRVAEQKERPGSRPGGKPAAGPAVKVASASKSPSAPAGNLGAVEVGFTYDETGKRDPFRSFLMDRAERLALQKEVRGPLEQFDLSQLSLVAVVWQTGNARALISDPSGETYIVAEGAKIGKNDGRLIAIEDSLVRVKETYIDYLGRETTKDIEMRMRRNEGG